MCFAKQNGYAMDYGLPTIDYFITFKLKSLL